MEVRGLESGDASAIRNIARRSLEMSYDGVLSPEVINDALESWYSESAIAEYLEGEEMMFLVAEEEEAPVGFSQSHVIEDLNKGRILWIHVDPDQRGAGVGRGLLEQTRDRLHDRGIDAVTAVALESYEDGVAFYTAHGFEQLATRTISIGSQEYAELVLREPGIEYDPLEMRLTPDGEEVFLDFDESDRGSKAPFCAVYLGPRRERRWGWFCTFCESFATNMDTMGRIQCSDCHNTRKPTRWDASYL